MLKANENLHHTISIFLRIGMIVYESQEVCGYITSRTRRLTVYFIVQRRDGSSETRHSRTGPGEDRACNNAGYFLYLQVVFIASMSLFSGL